MFNKKYKKGMADAAKAYEAFGQKQSDAIAYILEEVRQGRLDLSSAVKKLQGNVDSLYEYLKSTEKAELYTVYTPFDIRTLGIPERQFLVGALYRLTMDRLPSEYQQNYLRAVQRYLEIKEPPFGVDPLAIENIESIPFQKAIFQTVVEFLRLQDGNHYDETDLQHNFLESFSLNTKTKQEIFAHVEILFAATGAIGLAEKYGFVPEDEVAEEETVESRKEKAVKNQKEREDAALKIFSLFDNEFGHHKLRDIRSHSIETDNYFIVYLVPSVVQWSKEHYYGPEWLRALRGLHVKEFVDQSGLYAINKKTAEATFLFSYNDLPNYELIADYISCDDILFLQLRNRMDSENTEVYVINIQNKSIQSMYTGAAKIVSCDGVTLVLSTYRELTFIDCKTRVATTLNIQGVSAGRSQEGKCRCSCMMDGKLYTAGGYLSTEVDCYGIKEKRKLWSIKIRENNICPVCLSAIDGKIYLLLKTNNSSSGSYPGRNLYSIVRFDAPDSNSYTVIQNNISIYCDHFGFNNSCDDVGQYSDGLIYVRGSNPPEILDDFRLAFYCFGKETDIELANNCGKRGITKGGLFSKGELTAKAGYFDRIGDVCFVEIDENGSLARVSIANPMNAVLM